LNEKRVVQALSAHADELCGQQGALRGVGVSSSEQRRLAPLLNLASRLSETMRPVEPSLAFVRSLGRELMRDAECQVEVSKKRRRSAVIGAAAVGSVLSVASVIGAIVYVNSRSRARAEAGAAAPTA